MTDLTTLLALASRVEAATATEQREMLEAAFVAVHGPKPARVHGGTSEWIAWLDLHNPFFALLQAGGFIDAAMSLVPWDAYWRLGHDGDGADPAEYKADVIVPKLGGVDARGRAIAVTPPLALTAACLRAIARNMTDD